MKIKIEKNFKVWEKKWYFNVDIIRVRKHGKRRSREENNQRKIEVNEHWNSNNY